MRAFVLPLLLGLAFVVPAVADLSVDPETVMQAPAAAVEAATGQSDEVSEAASEGTSVIPCSSGYVSGVGALWTCTGKAPEQMGVLPGNETEPKEPAPEAQEAPSWNATVQHEEALPDQPGSEADAPSWTEAQVPPPEPRPEEAPRLIPTTPRPAEPRPATVAAIPPADRMDWPLAATATGAVLALPFLVKWLPMAALRRRARQDAPAQRLLVALIQAHPGIHHAELRRQAGLANGTVEHYVRRLEKAGAIVVHRTAGHTCYVVQGEPVARTAAARHLALRSPVARRLVQILGEGGSLSLPDLSRRSGAPLSTVHYQVRKMELAGLLAFTAGGRQRLVGLRETVAPNQGGPGEAPVAQPVGEPS